MACFGLNCKNPLCLSICPHQERTSDALPFALHVEDVQWTAFFPSLGTARTCERPGAVTRRHALRTPSDLQGSVCSINPAVPREGRGQRLKNRSVFPIRGWALHNKTLHCDNPSRDPRVGPFQETEFSTCARLCCNPLAPSQGRELRSLARRKLWEAPGSSTLLQMRVPSSNAGLELQVHLSHRRHEHDGFCGRWSRSRDIGFGDRRTSPKENILQKVVRLVRQERVQQQIVEQNIGVPVPQILQEGVERAKLAPHERVQRRTPEYIVDVPVLHVVEVERLVPPGRAQQIDEQIVEVLVPQISEDRRRVQNCTSGANFRGRSANRSWTSLFRRSTCLKLFSFKFVRFPTRFKGSAPTCTPARKSFIPSHTS